MPLPASAGQGSTTASSSRASRLAPPRRAAPRAAAAARVRMVHPQRRIQQQQPMVLDAQPLLDVQLVPGVGSPLAHLQEGPVYLDWNATTPIFPEVAAAMQPFTYASFGNPSSSHAYGQQTRAAVDTARQQVAALINCLPDELVFTSCGTESDNWALWGSVMARRSTVEGGVPHVVTSAIEHPAITSCLKSMQELGLCTFTAVPVDSQGLVSPADVVAALTPQTVLVSVMHSNNEVGSIQPVGEIAAAVKAARPDVWVHSDAAQSMGKVDVDVKALQLDMLTVVGHKFGAPKGVAALYVKRGVQLANLLSGGSQENGRRSGTENVLLIVGLGAAAEVVFAEREALQAHMRAMRDRLAAGLLAVFPRHLVQLNGPTEPSKQLPNTLSISVKGLAAASLLQQLAGGGGKRGVAASAGAACHSSRGPAVSPVLSAMQLGPTWAVGTLRLSTGRHTTPADVDEAVQAIYEAAKKQGVLAASDGAQA